MESAILSVLPELGIGVGAIVALVHVVNRFLDTLKDIRETHEISMKEREEALRDVEKEVRTNVTEQLVKNTEVMRDATKALERVIRHIE